MASVLVGSAGGLVGGLATSTVKMEESWWAPVTYALTALLALAAVALVVIPSKVGTGTEEAARRHYLTILNRVDALNAERLRTSLRELVRIELDLVALQEDSALRPEVILQDGRGGARLAGGIVEAWRESEHSLLLLGAPGAGKSTMLLELAAQLAATARRDFEARTPDRAAAPAEPIPVLVDLTDWRARRLSLRQGRRRHLFRRRRMEPQVPSERDPVKWLVSWLRFGSRYRIPQEVARLWLENDGLVLLFDGLDEVPENHRAACVEWLNALIAKRPLVPIAVVSRTQEFAHLRSPLNLKDVAEIQPLSREKVETYLNEAGAQTAPISVALAADERLWELLTAPIWLLIIILARREAAEMGAVDSIDEGRKRLLDGFVAKAVHRKRPSDHYSPNQTVRWLAQLARLSRWDLRVTRIFMGRRNEDDAWASVGLVAVCTVAAGALSLPLARSYGLVTTIFLGAIPVGFFLVRSASAVDTPLVFPCLGLPFGLLVVTVEQNTIPWFRDRFASIPVGWMMSYTQSAGPYGGGEQVDLHQWITEDQFRDFMAVYTPGVIAVMVTYGFFLWGTLEDGDTRPGMPFAFCALISVAPFVIALTDHAQVFGPFRGYWDGGGAWALPMLLAGAVVALPFLVLRYLLKPATAYFGYTVTAFATFTRHVARGRVPLRLRRFLRQAADHHLLIRDHTGYRFPHALLRDHFAQLDPVTTAAPPPPEIRGDNAPQRV